MSSLFTLLRPAADPLAYQDFRLYPVPGPPTARPDPEDITQAARRALPIEASVADRAFEDFFRVFPFARGLFEIRYVNEPSSEVGGSFGSGWNLNPPVVVINLASKPDSQRGFRSGKGSLRANVFHEGGHFISLIDGQLRRGQSHIRSMIEEATGISLPGAIEIHPDLTAVLATEVSPYGTLTMRELTAESVVTALQRWPGTSLARAIGDYYIEEYGPGASKERLVAALSQPPGAAYNVPGGDYVHVNTLGYCRWGVGVEEAFVRTPTEILRISNGGVFGLSTDHRGRVTQASRGWVRSVELGEELVQPGHEPNALSGVVVEMATCVSPAEKLESHQTDISRGDIPVFDDVPPIIAEYEEAQFKSWDRHSELDAPCRYVQTPEGFVTLAIDQHGATVKFDELVDSFGDNRTVFVEDYSGGRHIIGQFEGESLAGTHGRHQSTRYYGRQEGNSLTIGPETQYFDFGNGRVLKLDGVRRVELEPSRLRLSNAFRSSLGCGQSTLWSTRQIIDSHRTLQYQSHDNDTLAMPPSSVAQPDLSWL